MPYYTVVETRLHDFIYSVAAADADAALMLVQSGVVEPDSDEANDTEWMVAENPDHPESDEGFAALLYRVNDAILEIAHEANVSVAPVALDDVTHAVARLIRSSEKEE